MLLALARIYGTTVSELLGETAAERDAIVRAPHRIAAHDPDGVELLFVHTLLQSPTATLRLGPTPGDMP